MVGVGIDDQLRVRDVLLQDERVDRVDDQILAAIHHERRLRERLEVVVGALALGAPFRDRLYLPWADRFVDLGISVYPAEALTFQELQPRSLGLVGWTEMNGKPKMLRRIVGRAEDPLRLRRQRRHGLTATRAGADQDQLANELR